MFKSFSATALAAALSFLVIGAAGAQVSNPDKVYSKIDTSVVLSILAEIGFSTSVSQSEGMDFITATKVGRAPLVMSAASCGAVEMPNCSLFMIMSFAPISILPGATAETQLANLASVNAYKTFLPVKFVIIDPSMLTALRTELYPYGGTRGNISMSIDVVAELGATAFATLKSMAESTPAFSGTLDRPLTSSDLNNAPTYSIGDLQARSSILSTAPESEAANTPQAKAAQKAIELIGTLMQSKSFRQDILPSE